MLAQLPFHSLSLMSFALQSLLSDSLAPWDISKIAVFMGG
jgi:hypothetical protein